MKSLSELLQEYKELLDQGVITQEEYDLMKNKLLANGVKQYKDADEEARDKAKKSEENKEKAEKVVTTGLAAIYVAIKGATALAQFAIIATPIMLIVLALLMAGI